MKVRISWVERTLKEQVVEVKSMAELSDFEPIFCEGKAQRIDLENNSIKYKEIIE